MVEKRTVKLMGRGAALVATALMLAACGDFDASKYTVNPGDLLSGAVRLDLESEPAGADAKSSTGPSCRTPCALWIKPGTDLTVTFALDGYQPQTVPVAATYVSPARPELGGSLPAHADLDPNPARVVLALIPPPPEPPEPPPGKRRPGVAWQQGKPTHIVSATANLFAATAPGSTPIRKLSTGTAVTRVTTESGWTLVAREGKILGYVATADLIPIQ
jgi:hypothetical protein